MFKPEYQSFCWTSWSTEIQELATLPESWVKTLSLELMKVKWMYLKAALHRYKIPGLARGLSRMGSVQLLLSMQKTPVYAGISADCQCFSQISQGIWWSRVAVATSMFSMYMQLIVNVIKLKMSIRFFTFFPHNCKFEMWFLYRTNKQNYFKLFYLVLGL